MKSLAFLFAVLAATSAEAQVTRDAIETLEHQLLDLLRHRTACRTKLSAPEPERRKHLRSVPSRGHDGAVRPQAFRAEGINLGSL